MIRSLIRITFLTFSSLLFSVTAMAASSDVELRQMDWEFDGAFGTVDDQAAQRGFQVYQQVCASCHGMNLVSYRNLEEIGFSADEVKAIAAERQVIDGPNAEGEMFERAALPSDRFVNPYPNEQASRVANGGAYPSDLSLMVKARADGANYIYSLLTGYGPAPEGVTLNAGMYYNHYFPGNQIAMPQPLMEGSVEYQDGTQASVDQMSRDVVNFLQWAAEPEMETRKAMGLKVLAYLLIFTLLFYAAKRRIWKDVE